jgi:hypothetical protein
MSGLRADYLQSGSDAVVNKGFVAVPSRNSKR